MGASPRRWWVSSAQQPSLMYQSPAPTGQESTGAVCFATSTVPTTNSACTGAAPGGWIDPTTRCSSRSGDGLGRRGWRVACFPARVDELRDVGGERRSGFRRDRRVRGLVPDIHPLELERDREGVRERQFVRQVRRAVGSADGRRGRVRGRDQRGEEGAGGDAAA